jgi:2-C-methyl-D-erythritol 2,4-cyclodiphosphate synthase
LRAVVAQLDEAGWTVGNVDLTVIAQTPRLSSHIDEMRERMAADLRVTVGSVNVKATTTEKLGFLGREEGIASHAVALIMNEGAAA